MTDWFCESERAVEAVKRHNINFIALDFDLTLVEIVAEKLHKPDQVPVRPIFKHFVPIAMANGIHVGVVSFSKHADLIEAVLHHNFPTLSSQIIVRCNQAGNWNKMESKMNKQLHIASVACALMTSRREGDICPVITKASTLLIDDDGENVRCALENGVNALYLNPKSPELILTDILDLYSTD